MIRSISSSSHLDAIVDAPLLKFLSATAAPADHPERQEAGIIDAEISAALSSPDG